ncbi:DNA processing protein [Okibacterium sp. HSC-33S16]|uniref:DNA-processing protein DprA n=1 Tax=Okibacterium sp. HSC-33S16 TaxID=2910965 RepID=UPI0020A226D6|nr:DNA-processing protein DprA [Okibacterium sp. HSC-33S16]MCP2030572.1 DNA processing protein [Okibacterium sp. HSC-33S16]
MQLFGLDADEVRRAIATVAPTPTMSLRHTGASANDSAERFARAAWTTVAEPGDGTAGGFIATVGASTSLISLVEQWSTTRIMKAMEAAQGEDSMRPGWAEELDKARARWLPRLNSAAALAAVRLAAHSRATLLTPDDADWPESINDLDAHAPIALWVRGNPGRFVESRRSLSMVGARAATGYGEHVTVEAASSLVGRGFAIVSGAAYGIDGAAHRAALASQGTTVAFLAGGVDRPYPSGHDVLIGRIVETGIVVSEVPCGASPTKWRFLQRNRLIAALSQATVVLEAGWRSGSLNTAGHAAALGRPLGAVPGSVTSAASAGCHRLIREYGATCVTNADEMAELVDGGDAVAEPLRPSETGGAASFTSDELRVLDALTTRTGRPVADIARRTGLPIDVVQAVLGVLQIGGAVAEHQHGWIYVTAGR